MNTKHFFITLLAFISINVFSAEIIDSGTCGANGDNLTWTLTDDGTLTISGTGDMNSGNSSTEVPWDKKRNTINKVIIQDGVTSIGSSAFEGCYNLTSVTIPNSVISIGREAFSYCEGLTSITIPNSVTSIGESAFYYCSSLTAVHISDIAAWCAIDFNYFYDNPLRYAENLYLNGELVTDLIIPESVETIQNSAFYNCKSLTSVTIPNSVTSIGGYAFYGCSSLTSIVWNAKNCTNFNSYSDSPFFESHKNITSFVFGGEVKHIPAYLCYGMSALPSITIPNSVISIGHQTFYSCSSLTSVTIPNSVTNIGDAAFGYCSSLTNITIPNSVTSIGESAFYYCNSLPVIDNLRYADTYLVEAVDRTLSTYNIKEGTKWISEFAFEDCRNLTSITIPNSVTSIGDGAFCSCSGLTSMRVEQGNTIYDSRENCNAIIETASNTLISGCMNTIIPNSITSIGDFAFCGCSSLTNITIPNSITSIGGGAFVLCEGLTSITIPNSVTSIGGSAFEGCYSLTSITIPDKVPIIEYSCFNYCTNLTSVTLGSSVKAIEEYALKNCPNIKTITCYSMRPPTVQENAFGYNCDGSGNCDDPYLPYSTIVYVPADYLADYKAYEFWGLYDVRPLDTTDIDNIEGNTADHFNSSIRKVIENGNVYILLPDGRKLNMQGAEVK